MLQIKALEGKIFKGRGIDENDIISDVREELVYLLAQELEQWSPPYSLFNGMDPSSRWQETVSQLSTRNYSTEDWNAVVVVYCEIQCDSFL